MNQPPAKQEASFLSYWLAFGRIEGRSCGGSGDKEAGEKSSGKERENKTIAKMLVKEMEKTVTKIEICGKKPTSMRTMVKKPIAKDI